MLLLAVALAAAGLGYVAHRSHLLRRPEQQTIDTRFQIRGPRPQLTSGIVVVGIDNASIQRLGELHLQNHFPFPYRFTAQVIDHLHRAGAKLIVLDMQITEPESEADDEALLQAIDRARPMVLLTELVDARTGKTNLLGSEEKVREVGARAGDNQFPPDTDGAVRSMQYSIRGLRTAGVVIAEVDTGRPVSTALFGGARTLVPIDYSGPPGAVRSLHYSSVYEDRFPRALVAGKIVVIGDIAPSLGDTDQTPVGSGTPMPGSEIIANAAASVLHGLPLRNASEAATLLAIALLALLVCGAGLWLDTLGVAVTGIALLLGWSVAAQLAFNSGTILDYSDPAASLLLASGGTVLGGLWSDRRETRRLREAFAADAGLVEDVLRHSGHRPIEPTAIIAGYRIEQPIARGGMGVVYRATQLSLHRTVALKLIAAERAQDPEFRARFKLESQLAASIEHVNVIPVYEAGEDDGLLFISMRLVDGTDLARVLGQDGPLAPLRTCRVIAQLAVALDAAHAHGLVHRDVKPANVLLTRDAPEHVYLTDFGVAKHIGAGADVTVAGRWVGTLDYLAPEQIRGESASGAVDVYALAGVLHHCLTGEVPFPRENDAALLWAHVNGTPLPASSLRPGIPVDVDRVIARGMAKDPADRFGTPTELARALESALGVELRGAAPEPSGAPDAGALPTSASEPLSQDPGAAASTVISD